MTNDQREIHRKKRIIEYAERIGNVHKTCRYFGVARSTLSLWRDRYRELGDEGLRSRSWAPIERAGFKRDRSKSYLE